MRASRYRISRLIERGGTAEVFEASVLGEHGFERKVALKKLREEILAEEGFVEHFIDEARIAAQLHHANVVSVFDFGVMDERPFLVLEYVDGVDLGRLARESGGIPAEVALAVTLEVARALAYAHKARDARGAPLRIVHRDVSPSNVLVSWAGDVKLSDFGIALAVERLGTTQVGYAKGKLSFMSPEQMNGSSVDARADLYALGCLLHWMVTGESPLDRDEVRETVRRGGECTISRELDRDVAWIVARATRTDPNRRPKSADELAGEVASALLKRTIESRSILARFMESLAPAREPASRSPLAEMMDVELVLAGAIEPYRRFSSVISEGQTALSNAHTDEVEPEGLEKTEADTPSPRDKLLGSMLHGYRLTQLIGRGSVARVYRAKHMVLDREYAVKVLFGRAAEKDRGKLRLQREAQALSKLQHENVVSVFDYGVTDDGRPFLTMELLRGVTLKDLVAREGPLEPARAASIARQLAAGLEAAHRAGLVHRDLKPGNIMLVAEMGREVAKILDFGIVRADKAGTRITASDQLLGTPRYMAPEQILGASNVGPRADLYSLGVVLYMMLAGKPPFTGSTVEVIERQLSEKPKPLDTGTALDELAIWLLAKSPEERPPSAGRVVEWLAEAGFEEETARTQVLPPTLQTPVITIEPVGPSRLLIPALFALVLAIGALAGALWWPRATAQQVEPTRIPIPSKAPVVIARPGPEPPPAPAAAPVPPPPPAVVEAPSSKRAKPPRPRKQESAEELHREVRTALKRRGLDRRDLATNARMQALLRQFEDEREPAQMKRHADQLIAALDTFPIDDAVKPKLDRVAKTLAGATDLLDRAALDRLENRYLDLRSSFRPGLSRAELTALMIRIDNLERDLRQAVR